MSAHFLCCILYAAFLLCYMAEKLIYEMIFAGNVLNNLLCIHQNKH